MRSINKNASLFKKLLGNKKVYLYVIFRVFVGLLFFQHGAGKLFGWFGGKSVELVSLMGVAGVVEFVGGAAIVLGVFTRLSALGAAITMAAAYFMVHFPRGLNPATNRGELALVYFAAFLVLFAYGAGKLSLEKKIFKKKIF